MGHKEEGAPRHGREKRRHHRRHKNGESHGKDRSPEDVIKHVEEHVRHGLHRHGLRDQVVVARVDQEVMARLDQLVEAGIFQSRSEAAATLLRDAIRVRGRLFDSISEKVSELSALKESLRETARREFFPGLDPEDPAATGSEGSGR